MSKSHLETLQAEIAAISGTPLAKAIGGGSGNAPVDLLKSHIDSFTRKDGTVVNAHDDKRVKKATIPHAHAAAFYPGHANEISNMKHGDSLTVDAGKAKHQITREGEQVHISPVEENVADKKSAAAKAEAQKLLPAEKKMLAEKSAKEAKDKAMELLPAEKKQSSAPPIHAHTGEIRKLAEERKGNGTDDHEGMHYIADSLDKGDHEAAASTLKHMDTEPRDAVLDHVHPEHREKLGFSNIDKDRNIAKFEKDHPAPEKKQTDKDFAKEQADKYKAGNPPPSGADDGSEDDGQYDSDEKVAQARKNAQAMGSDKASAKGEKKVILKKPKNDTEALRKTGEVVRAEMKETQDTKAAVARLSETEGYAKDDYGNNWGKCGELLLGAGLNEKQAAWVLASKHMRWATVSGDANENFDAFKRYLADPKNSVVKDAKKEVQGSDDDMAKNLSGADLLKSHIDAFVKKDKP